MQIALLTAYEFNWIVPLALRCDAFEWTTLHPSRIGLRESPNPFHLPVRDNADLVVLEATWYDWLMLAHPEKARAVLERLERLGFVGLDGTPVFQLFFEPAVVARARLILKVQGVYRDLELYNYALGQVRAPPGRPTWHPQSGFTFVRGLGAARWPEVGVWAEKRFPQEERYRDEDLAKIKRSLPNLLRDVPPFKRADRRREAGPARTRDQPMPRRERLARNAGEFVIWRAIRHAPIGQRPRDVHCLVALTHVQRLDALQALEGLDGTRGITSIPSYVSGVDEPESLAASAQPFMHRRLGRLDLTHDLLRHRVVVAPCGYGELTFRHGEALQTGTALVCQDLSHVDIMFPFQDGHNVVYCRPDLANLREQVEWLLADERSRSRIARQGRTDYFRWAKRWREHLAMGIERPLRDAAT